VLTAAGPVREYTGDRLLAYLSDEASFSSPYQPVLIAALVRAGGRAKAGRLAELLVSSDPVLAARARRALMRWPLRTFRRHGIADYDRASGEFVLPVRFASDRQRDEVLALCGRLAVAWAPRPGGVSPGRRYALIEKAAGRCQACGAAGSEQPLEVDHVVPRASARHGNVRTAHGRLVPLDSPENLQVLCAACNRGKRDVGAFDFRPSLARLAETMNATAARAADLGYSAAELGAARDAAQARSAAASSAAASSADAAPSSGTSVPQIRHH
jgi:5-methylcytosine-specific restriction endonuclease McrA